MLSPLSARRRPRSLHRPLILAIAACLLASYLQITGQPASAATSLPRAAAQTIVDPSLGDGALAYYPFTTGTNGTATNYAGGADAIVHAGATQGSDFEPPALSSGITLKLDGTAGYLSAPLPLSTTASFTAAGWVKLTKVDHAQVLLSQDGAQVSAFSLGLDGTGAWTVNMPRADSASATADVARGPAAVAGQWTHLAAVFNAPTSDLMLYVNGTKAATVKHTALWPAGGPVQIGRGLRAGAGVDYAGGSVDSVRAWSVALSDEAVMEAAVPAYLQRAGWCMVGNWLHAGGPVVKASASTALSGTAYDREVARRWKVPGVGGSVMEDARRGDWTAYNQVVSARGTQLSPVFAYLDGLDMRDTPDDATFRTQPTYAAAIDTFLLNNQDDDPTFEAKYIRLPLPKPVQQSLDKALAIAADMRARPAYYHVPVVAGTPLVPSDATIRGWSATRIAAWLRFGGYPTVTPEPDSAEFRFEVEVAKQTWSDCDTGDLQGTFTPESMVAAGGNPPLTQPGPLAQVATTAQHEWTAELAAQAAPRNTLVAAEIQANQDVRTATEAMLEAQYEAWVAGQLLKWKKLWLSRPTTYTGYPAPADFTKVNNALAAIPNQITTQLGTAQQALTSANTQSSRVDAAKQQAADIANANGTPLYRGLAYARQSAQVTKASAAAAQAAVSAIQTTLNAVRATNADGAALEALAATQQAAQQAEFRKVAAQEAAAQAKAAADAAAARATAAADAAAVAKTKRTAAEQALATAQINAAKAADQRQIAEQKRQIAADQEAIAEQKHAEAAAADADAQRQQSVATSAEADAQAAAATAAAKDADAQSKAATAAAARDAADRARRQRDGAAVRAAAMNAAAAAAAGTADAQAAQDAATEAQADADRAASAADAAQADADTATAAAIAAREAATQARAAAAEARSAANAAALAAAQTRSNAASAHSASADALAAAHAAAADADAAMALAAQARADTEKASADSAAAQLAAADARAGSARTAGEAYAASVWAMAARDSAAAVIAPANTAIVLGGQFQQTDASAGLAVLVGQESKAMADQQQAVAQARSDDASAAAAAAETAAANATADAKDAAQAVADAAASSADAARSALAAQTSAAAAAVDAAAAATADASAKSLAAQATSDAAAANTAATAAEQDAAAADLAADAAERDAASARQAAADAQAAAQTAQLAASQAARDAADAETAAANARAAAEAAEQTAQQAQADANTQAEANAAGANGATGVDNVVAIPIDVQDDIATPVDCQVIDLTHCTATIHHHLYGRVAYYVRTCPDPTAPVCPGEYTFDFLATVRIDTDITETRILNPMLIVGDFWKAVGGGMIQDFVDCADGKLGKCALIAAEILLPAALGGAARAIIGLRIALRTGEGLEGAVAAVEAAGLDAGAEAAIENVAISNLEDLEGSGPTMTELRARLAELLRRRTLGLDQAVGLFRRAEMETALRIEAERGVILTRSTGTSEDWFDQFNRSYDAVGSGMPASQFDAQWPNLQAEIISHLSKARFVPVDVAGLTPDQVATVQSFIQGLNNANVFIVGA